MNKKSVPSAALFIIKKKGFRARTRVTSHGDKKEEIQRWSCKDCGSSFSFKRKGNTKFQNSLAFKAADLYFSSEASYRAVGRELNLRPNKALELVNNLGDNCKSFTDVAHELKPTWSGYLLIDGKAIYVKKRTLCIAVDSRCNNS